ncbi:MAG TPA: ribonuclease III [bacterium]|nr:ribonuclease III [bacterium]
MSPGTSQEHAVHGGWLNGIIRFFRRAWGPEQADGFLPDNGLRLQDLSRVLGVRIENPKLYIQALKHRSFLNVSNEKHFSSYERMEFLGDAILSTITAEFLFQKYPESDEGFLTKGKSHLVNKKTLAHKAEALGLGQFIVMSDGEERSGGRSRSSILSDVFEALIAAVYLDHGYHTARKFVLDTLLCDTERILQSEMNSNFKGDLLEYTQGKDLGIPQYIVVSETGPEHQKEFTIQVAVKDTILGCGKGLSKKEAEQQAAKEALQRIKNNGIQ